MRKCKNNDFPGVFDRLIVHDEAYGKTGPWYKSSACYLTENTFISLSETLSRYMPGAKGYTGTMP